MLGRVVSRLVSYVTQIFSSKTQVISFFPFGLHQDSGFCMIFPAQPLGGGYQGSGHPHVTPKSLRRWSQTWVSPLRAEIPSRSPTPRTSLSVLNGVTGPFLNHKRTRTTTARIVGAHLWAGRGSPDSECVLLLIPKQSHSSISKNKGWGSGFQSQFERQSNDIYSRLQSSRAPNNLNYISCQKVMKKPSQKCRSDVKYLFHHVLHENTFGLTTICNVWILFGIWIKLTYL